MSKEDEKKAELAVAITLFILFILWLVNWIQLKIIHLSRFFFWLFLSIAVVSIVSTFFCLIKGIIDEWDKSTFFIIGAISIFIFIISIPIINISYDNGYSQEALRKEAELIGKLQEYEELMSLFSFEDILTEELMNTEIETLCKVSPDSCENIKITYQVYQDIKGAKDFADKIMFFKKTSKYITQ